MAFSGKKYLALAFAGAVILGAGTYILLNNYFERVDIAVAAGGIEKNSKIEEKDIRMLPYYKQALPEGYISEKSEIIGMIIKAERKTGDPLTTYLFSGDDTPKSMFEGLAEDEVLMAINLNYQEPLMDELKIGNNISIVSTEKEKDSNYYYTGSRVTSEVNGNSVNIAAADAAEITMGNTSNETSGSSSNGIAGSIDKSIIDLNTFSLDENILIIDGQIIIKNLNIVDIKKTDIESNGLIAAKNKSSWCIFIKCSIKEAPAISRITKEDKYKIFLEKVSAE